MVIGVVDGPPEETFHKIRGAVAADNGMVVVADGGSAELRVYSAEGDFVRSFGRIGDGPREFRMLSWIDMCGGPVIVAYDRFRRRITKWDTEGVLQDEFLVEGVAADLPPYRVRCGPSGSFVVMGWSHPRDADGEGPYRPIVPIGLADERGRPVRVLGDFPTDERLRTGAQDGPYFFGRRTSIAMGPAGVYVGTADSFSVELIDSKGAQTTFGLDRPLQPMSDASREQWIDWYLDEKQTPDSRRASFKRTMLQSEWVPHVPPAYGEVLVDNVGFVWVEPYVIGKPVVDTRVEWTVFDSQGTLVATAMLPGGFRPTEIGTDYLLGVGEDEFGIERVYRYTLARQ
jgi:hypothetical protein